MKKYFTTFCFLSLLFVNLSFVKSSAYVTDYVIAASETVKADSEWVTVVYELQKNYPNSKVIFYEKSLKELLPELRILRPRYLAVVDKPENINREFVIEGNIICRTIDEDIYDDYIWGIISGYSYKDALRTVRQSSKSFVLKTALSTTSEVRSGVWFDRMAWIDDGVKGRWGEKRFPSDEVHSYETDNPQELLTIFYQKWKELDPDVILTSAHATQDNLEMPFSIGNVKSEDGRLYAEFSLPQNMPETKKPRVYLPIGNCLIGDMNNTDQSMASAWLSSGGATAMLGYVVSTWYGRNGWGALKYYLSAPSKHTLAEAAFLNRQDMLTQEYRNNPDLITVKGDFVNYGDRAMFRIDYDLRTQLSIVPTIHDIGFIYDRDVVVYYGDPAWNVRTQNVPDMDCYDFSFGKNGNHYIIKLKTKDNFSIEKTSGKGFKDEHVCDIPIAYFFPERIFSPEIVSNKNNLDIAFDENFLLVYDKDLEPGKEYTIIIK